jgi:methionyl-tRNA synthetase
MTTSTSSFITTAIPYVNARPHLGFAYELVLADVLARHRRSRGRDVRFVTGTDDHSLKNVVAASREGVATRELVDRNASAFRALGPLLDISADDFIATSKDPRHRTAVEWLWRRCRDDLHSRLWNGRYCAGCEAFVDDDVERCDEHGTVPEPVTETNWFFRLSRWREPVLRAIESGRLAIVPDAARAETLAFLRGDVRDLSVSRDAARSQGWGIAVPDDPSQVIYVWFDALANYLAALGVGGGDTALLDRYWLGTGERVHVIGKGITRFHAAFWPAFLLAAGLPLPDRIAVHGYLTVYGAKISKSKGETLAVDAVVADVGADALRWYFARCCRSRVDSDVSLAAIAVAHDRDLADQLGNLVQRCTALAAKLGTPTPSDSAEAHALLASVARLPARVDAAIDRFAIDEAATAIVELVGDANREVEHAEPWRTHDASALHAPLEAARVAVHELAPFVPGIARAVAIRLDQPGAPPVPRLRARRRGSTPPVA